MDKLFVYVKHKGSNTVSHSQFTFRYFHRLQFVSILSQ